MGETFSRCGKRKLKNRRRGIAGRKGWRMVGKREGSCEEGML